MYCLGKVACDLLCGVWPFSGRREALQARADDLRPEVNEMWEEDGATNWYPQMGRLQRLRLLRMVDRTKGAWFLERGLMAVLTCSVLHACMWTTRQVLSIHPPCAHNYSGRFFVPWTGDHNGRFSCSFLTRTNYEPLIQTFSKGRKFSFTSLPLYSWRSMDHFVIYKVH